MRIIHIKDLDKYAQKTVGADWCLDHRLSYVKKIGRLYYKFGMQGYLEV